jgi:L-fuculose-phosphate aldolase
MQSEQAMREQMVEIGRRLYARGFAAGNDGNLSCRLNDDLVLCTPTLICKGFMQPDDLCIVDLDGQQQAGERKATSEIKLHLEIYRQEPAAQAVVHCHPPHATAFGVAGEEIPSGILPEVEVFLGWVPRAPYETPGSGTFAQTVRPFIGKANTVVLSNHGTVSWADTLEQAYWQTEILDGYCRILILAKQIGGVSRLPRAKVEDLLNLREAFGKDPDPRRTLGMDLFVNREFGEGDTPTAE